MNIKIYLLIYVFLAPLITHQVYYLTFHFDNSVLWFGRYLFGGIFLLFLVVIFKRHELIRLLQSKLNIRSLLIFAAMLILGSFTFSIGVKMTNATTGNLVYSLALPLTVGMAYALWGEEGEMLKNRFAQMGFIVILLGIVGFSLCGGQFAAGGNFGLGVIILLVGMASSCGATLLLRSLLRNNDPVVVSGVGMSMACVLLFIPLCLFGEISGPGRQSIGVFAFLAFSGIFGAAVFLFSLYVLKISGVGVFNILNLAIPVTSAIFGVSFMGESFRPEQIFFGLVLLGGSYLCLYRERANSSSGAAKVEDKNVCNVQCPPARRCDSNV